ncbi:MAG: hypothetical protein KJO98_02970 [Rhodothermia bacterium]|nr:hypothetical protein [Rhodothermia bacterium]
MSSDDRDDRDDGRSRRASLNALSLLATADFIVDFGDGRRRRKDEEVTSSQQAIRLRQKALLLTGEIDELSARIRLFALLAQAPEDTLVSDMHLFELLRAANACNARLRHLHQTLMSLYPEVTAELVESVRIAIIDSEAFADSWGASSPLWGPSSETWSGAMARTGSMLISVRSALSEQGS